MIRLTFGREGERFGVQLSLHEAVALRNHLNAALEGMEPIPVDPNGPAFAALAVARAYERGGV